MERLSYKPLLKETDSLDERQAWLDHYWDIIDNLGFYSQAYVDYAQDQLRQIAQRSYGNSREEL